MVVNVLGTQFIRGHAVLACLGNDDRSGHGDARLRARRLRAGPRGAISSPANVMQGMQRLGEVINPYTVGFQTIPKADI